MADTLDILDLAEGRLAINVSSGHDAELARFITGMSRIIDDKCGPVVARSVTELHNGGCVQLRPFTTPIFSVSTLTEYVDTADTVLSAESNVSKPADGYLLDRDKATSHNVKIVRRSSGSDASFPAGRRNVELVVSAGRYADTASVDAKFKVAGGSILRRLWDREAGAWARGADPFDQAPGSRFFEAVMHVVKEQLADETIPIAVA